MLEFLCSDVSAGTLLAWWTAVLYLIFNNTGKSDTEVGASSGVRCRVLVCLAYFSPICLGFFFELILCWHCAFAIKTHLFEIFKAGLLCCGYQTPVLCVKAIKPGAAACKRCSL